jgi:hypothetical protein
MGHIPNWPGCDIHPPTQRTRRPRQAQHTHNQAIDNQERSLLAHMTVRLVLAHVLRRALYRAYTRNEPMSSPWPARARGCEGRL